MENTREVNSTSARPRFRVDVAGRKGRCCVEVSLSISLYSISGERENSMGTKWSRFVTRLKRKELKREERPGKRVKEADDWTGE